jgi:hypothetical protein
LAYQADKQANSKWLGIKSRFRSLLKSQNKVELPADKKCVDSKYIRTPGYLWAIIGDKANVARKEDVLLIEKLLSDVEKLQFCDAAKVTDTFTAVQEANAIYSMIIPEELKQNLKFELESDDDKMKYEKLSKTSFLAENESVAVLSKFVNSKASTLVDDAISLWGQTSIKNGGRHICHESAYLNTIVHHVHLAAKNKMPAKCLDIVISPRKDNETLPLMEEWNAFKKRRSNRAKWTRVRLSASQLDKNSTDHAEIDVYLDFIKMTLGVKFDDVKGMIGIPFYMIKDAPLLPAPTALWKEIRAFVDSAVRTLVSRDSVLRTLELASVAHQCMLAADALDSDLAKLLCHDEHE